MNEPTPCYACARAMRRKCHGVLTIDGQRQFVGPDCYAQITAAGAAGYQPPLGGPRLFAYQTAPAEVRRAAGILVGRRR